MIVVRICELLHNCRSRTTNPERIEVMELGGYSRTTCNKLCASSNEASTVVGVIHKLDRRRVLLTTRSTCRSEIFEVQSSRQSSRGKCPYFGDTLISLKHGVGYVEGSFHAKNSLIHSSVSTELRHVTDTDGHRLADKGIWLSYTASWCASSRAG